MEELKQHIQIALKGEAQKIIISNPTSKAESIKKVIVEKKNNGYHISKYTDKQVFHENINALAIVDWCFEFINTRYRQVNVFLINEERIILISRKGACNYKVRKLANDSIRAPKYIDSHNRKKDYILKEGMYIEPLIDMGIFSSDGKVINSMYDKYKQINRFIEILNDEIQHFNRKEINVIDFGCGKSYLTFVIYYYLTEIKKLKANVIGLDLKKEVIDKCNAATQKYGYTGLNFVLGDINGFKAPFDVDMVVTLHACDTATDYARFNAVKWNAKMIYSVPCCQHELNKQIEPETLSIMTRYGIVKERFSALATDAIRGNILEFYGYKTQLLEFIDFEHTPKNILIRAVQRYSGTQKKVRERYLSEVEALMNEFKFTPTLYKLLIDSEGENKE